MGQLRQHEFEDRRCVECQALDAVGPCAACEGMICGDCGVMTTDPEGKAVICLSCARLAASVGKRQLQKHSKGSKATTYTLLAVLATGILAALGQMWLG